VTVEANSKVPKTIEEDPLNLDTRNQTKGSGMDSKNMDSTFDSFADAHDQPKPEFGFKESPADEEGSGNSDEEKKILEDEIKAFKESIKIGEQKPNITVGLGLDKSDVDGKDSISETVQTEEKESDNDVTQGDNDVTQGDEGEQVEEKKTTEEGEQQISEEESSQNETINNEEESNIDSSDKKKDVNAHARQLKELKQAEPAKAVASNTSGATGVPVKPDNGTAIINSTFTKIPTNESPSTNLLNSTTQYPQVSNSSKPFQNQNFTTNDYANMTKGLLKDNNAPSKLTEAEQHIEDKKSSIKPSKRWSSSHTSNKGYKKSATKTARASIRSLNKSKRRSGVLKRNVIGHREHHTMKDHIRKLIKRVLKPGKHLKHN